MALTTRTFNDFDFNDNPQAADFIVGVCADGSAEFKTNIGNIGAYTTEGGSNSIQPLVGGNTASGCYSVISGGTNNSTNDNCVSIGGGRNNCTEYSYYDSSTASTYTQHNQYGGATIGGGNCNIASGCCNPTVAGGTHNIASGSISTVGGGCANHASGKHSVISGGVKNHAEGCHSVVAGGSTNLAFGWHANVGGGYANIAGFPTRVTVNTSVETSNGIFNRQNGGPYGLWLYNVSNNSYIYKDTWSNTWNLYDNDRGYVTFTNEGSIIDDKWQPTHNGDTFNYLVFNDTPAGTTVAGGKYNYTAGCGDVISGGLYNNTNSGYYDGYFYTGGGNTIGGGYNNTVSAYYGAATVSGGQNNCATADYASVGGGRCNRANGCSSVVNGGHCNRVRYGSDCSVIAGGNCNIVHVFSCNNSIVGGETNNICSGSCGSFIGGGGTYSCYNYNTNTQEYNLGNNIDSNFSSIIGGVCNNAVHDHSHVIGSCITTTQENATFVNNLVSLGNVQALQGAGWGSAGYTFGPDEGGADTGLFSINPEGGNNDSFLSIVSDTCTVLQASHQGVDFIRMKSPNGAMFKVTVTNTGSLSAAAL